MIKRIGLFLVLFVLAFSLTAQPSGERKTILFLIPFYTQEYHGAAAGAVQSSHDIHSVSSFLLMGFWAGAQVALEEYNDQNVALDVIVKDVTESESGLRAIMEDEELMNRVDLIIGPFFSKTFAIAVEYAKRYRIPIVNPFTNRTDILTGNEYVYKVIPSQEAKPITLSYIAESFPKYQFILLQDSSLKSTEQNTYKQYFQQHRIPFQIVSTGADLLRSIKPNIQNIVLIFRKNAARMLMLSRDLLYKANPEELLVVVPEEWLKSNTYDVEYYSKLNLHFFSNFYVDSKDQQTQVFVQRFKEKFKTMPTLDNFAYQGYDITRFFVELARYDGDLDRVKIMPIAYPMLFEKTAGGGYENVNINFLEIRNEEVVPAFY